MDNGFHYLAQAYFHQDFQETADEPIKVINVFCEREPAEVVRALQAGVASLLESDSSEAELSQIWLDHGGAYYDPNTDGITMREWLQNIADELNDKDEVSTADADPPASAEPSRGVPFKGSREN